MPKVKFHDGTVGYLSYPEVQEALLSDNPPEVLQDEDGQKNEGNQADKAEVVGVDEPDYEAMSRAELDGLAGDRKIDVSHARTKADVIALLKS